MPLPHFQPNVDKTSYPIHHRNDQLKQMFLNLGLDVKLIGDFNQPKIIVNDDYAISGFVQNRLYHFTTKPFQGQIVRTVNLNEPDLSINELHDLLHENDQRRFWKLAHSENDSLFYLKTENNVALFAFTDARYWFDRDRVIDTKKYLFDAFGIECRIVTSDSGNVEK